MENLVQREGGLLGFGLWAGPWGVLARTAPSTGAKLPLTQLGCSRWVLGAGGELPNVALQAALWWNTEILPARVLFFCLLLSCKSKQALQLSWRTRQCSCIVIQEKQLVSNLYGIAPAFKCQQLTRCQGEKILQLKKKKKKRSRSGNSQSYSSPNGLPAMMKGHVNQHLPAYLMNMKDELNIVGFVVISWLRRKRGGEETKVFGFSNGLLLCLKIVLTNKNSPLCHPVVLLLNSNRLLITAKIFSEQHMAGLAAKYRFWRELIVWLWSSVIKLP